MIDFAAQFISDQIMSFLNFWNVFCVLFHVINRAITILKLKKYIKSI